jgi:hypothetical protein
MSLKGDFRFRACGYVYLKQWYTGLKYKVPENKAYFCKSPEGLMVLADMKDAILDNKICEW